jgi:hypothetical protein
VAATARGSSNSPPGGKIVLTSEVRISSTEWAMILHGIEMGSAPERQASARCMTACS